MNTNKTKLLQKTYYDLSNSGAYFGPDELYRVLKFKDVFPFLDWLKIELFN
jgi:hypothetical protein